MSARWPLPMGETMSMTRGEKSFLRRIGDLELEALVGIERRQVVEMDLVPDLLRILEIDGVDLEQGEIALALLGAADRAVDRVAGAQAEPPDLRGRDIDVVGTGR